MIEHSIVELTSEWHGWPVGSVGTVVSEHPTCALVEFATSDGAASGFVEVPFGALRKIDDDHGHIAAERSDHGLMA